MPLRLLCALAGWAATSAAAQPIFQAVTRADGLPSDYVQAVAQDRSGFLWFGTDAGLARYDGQNVTTFTADDGLPSPFVYSIAEAPDGTLWVGTFAGVARSQGAGFVPVETPLGGVPVYRVMVDAEGRLLALSGRALVRQEGPGWRVYRPSEIAPWAGLVALPDGTLLAARHRADGDGSAVEVVHLAEEGAGRFRARPLAIPQAWKSARGIAADADGGVLIQTDQGLYRARQRSGRIDGQRIGAVPPFRELVAGPDGQVYGAHRGPGVWALSSAAEPVTPLSDARAQALTVDYEGGLWIGTFGEGAIRLMGRHLHRVTRTPAVRVAPGRDGSVWVTGEAVSRVDARTLNVRSRTGRTASRALTVGSDGVVWLTHGADLVRFADASFPSAVAEPVASHPSWGADLDVRADTLWMASYGDGIVRFVGGEARDTIGTADGLATGMIEGLARTSHGLWALTRSAGAYRVSGGTVQALTRDDGLPSSALYSVFEASDGAVWFGTDRGLGRWDGGAVQSRGVGLLAGQRIGAVFERPTTGAVVWALGERSLYRVDERGVREVSGFQVLPDARASINDAYYDPATDRLFMATSSGLVALDLAAVPEAQVAPRVAILRARVDDELRALEGSPRAARLPILPPGRHRVEVEFAALAFGGARDLDYRLDGEGWQRSPGRSVVFSGLSSGRHRVDVRAAGVPGGERASLTFEVAPFPWERPAVQGGAVVLLLLGFGWAVRAVSLRRLRRRLRALEAEREAAARVQRERQRISRDLHDHVGAQLTSLLAGVELARLARSAGGDGADPTDPLDGVESDARATMRQLRETIWALHDDSVSAGAFTERVRADLTARTAAGGPAPHVVCHADLELPLPPATALNLYRIVQEAVTNTLKHAGASDVTVTLSVEGGDLVLQVEDDGAFQGDPAATALSGFGMRSMRERAADVGGTFALATSAGTTVRVSIPLEWVLDPGDLPGAGEAGP